MKMIIVVLGLLLSTLSFAQQGELNCKATNLTQMEVNMCSSIKLDEETAKLVKKVLAVCMKDPEVSAETGGMAYEQVLNECAQRRMKKLVNIVK